MYLYAHNIHVHVCTCMYQYFSFNTVQFNTSVTALLLNGCKIGAQGGIHIASMLQVEIEYFLTSAPPYSAVLGRPLTLLFSSQLFQVNQTLEHLELAYTDLNTDCIIAMATVLHGNQALRRVDLSRPLLHSKLEETTLHISKMLQVR